MNALPVNLILIDQLWIRPTSTVHEVQHPQWLLSLEKDTKTFITQLASKLKARCQGVEERGNVEGKG